MATSDSDDIVSRVKRDIPGRWFASAAPIRDAILGGIADAGAWAYSLTGYARLQTRLATATGIWLDIFAYDFLRLHLRRKGSNDDIFRTRIRSTILQERVTRAGMSSMLMALTGSTPTIFEPWNTGDTGGWDTGAFAWADEGASSAPDGGWDVACGWDENAWCWDIVEASVTAGSNGAGAWGATEMPYQVLISVPPVLQQGVPLIGGWDTGAAAWDGGITEWVGDTEDGDLTADDIYEAIRITKPTGVIAWVNLQ